MDVILTQSPIPILTLSIHPELTDVVVLRAKESKPTNILFSDVTLGTQS